MIIFSYNYIGDYMFGPNTIKSSLSLTKILGGLSKGLNIVNQAIPIYKEVKPLVGNVKKVMGILKEFNTEKPLTPPKKEVTKKLKTITSSTNPTFFQ